jgi:hypothetical protein
VGEDLGMASRSRNRPPDLNRDHARPRSAPAPRVAAVEARLADLVRPATFGLVTYYADLGLRWRTLTLPIMVALILGLIWRQFPSVSALIAHVRREPLLWAPGVTVSQQALSQRLRTFPAELFAEVVRTLLPALQARAAARHRPLPPVLQAARRHFARVWAVDATTHEALFRKVGLLRDAPATVLGGTTLAVLDLCSKLPVQLWWEPDPAANEKRFLDRIQEALPTKTLLVFDKGFYSFPFFDWLTDHRCGFVTRARTLAAFTVTEVLLETERVRDRVIQFGVYRSNPCQHPVRLVEVLVDGTWRPYLTNVLDPAILSPAAVVDLYARRWRIEDAFLLVKRLLGLAYLWTGAANGVALQVWATWLLYAALVDLTDAVAEELDRPLDALSIEMVYRSLYLFAEAHARGEADDVVRFLAADAIGLHIVKRRRKYRERARLDKSPPDLNL